MEILNAIVNIFILIALPVFWIMAVHSYGRAKYWEGKNRGFDEACEMHYEVLEKVHQEIKKQEGKKEQEKKEVKK